MQEVTTPASETAEVPTAGATHRDSRDNLDHLEDILSGATDQYDGTEGEDIVEAPGQQSRIEGNMRDDALEEGDLSQGMEDIDLGGGLPEPEPMEELVAEENGDIELESPTVEHDKADSSSRSSSRISTRRPRSIVTTPPPAGRPPKPRRSTTPQPLSPSRYKPYGGPRQSSASASVSSSRPASAAAVHPESSSSSVTSLDDSPQEVFRTLPDAHELTDTPIEDVHDVSLNSPSRRDPTGTVVPTTPPSPPRTITNPSTPHPHSTLSPEPQQSGADKGFRSLPASPKTTPQSSQSHARHPSGSKVSFRDTPGYAHTQDPATYSPGETAPRSIPFKPALPTAALALNGQANGADGSAPFESIDLETNSPIHSAVIPSISRFDSEDNGHLSAQLHRKSGDQGGIDKKGKRRSWNGFGHKKSPKSQSLTVEHETDRRHSYAEGEHGDGITSPTGLPTGSLADEPQSHNAEAGPSTPPRRHAPPAHPHPYPIPTSPVLSSHRDSHTASRDSIPGQMSPKTIAQSNGSHSPSMAAAGLGVKGMSTFEKVISHTRPSWLPPKDKMEDEAHYHQWEEMMAQAREAETARRKIQEVRRAAREKKLAASVPRWEALLGLGPGGSTMSLTPDKNHLAVSNGMSRSASASSSKSKGSTGATTPNGTTEGFSVAKVKSDLGLRRLWFEGVPSHLRGRAWSLAIGNPLALSKDAYKTYLKRSQRALSSGRFPSHILEQLEHDLDNTLPHLKLYVPGSPMRDDLREFVCAWVVYRSDEGNGYAPYITHLSAMFLLNSPPALAFHSLVNLLSRPCLRAFFTQTTDEIDAFYRVFENLQSDKFPKIFANCKNLGLKLPESYFRSLFIEQIPFEACCRLWDQIILDGDGYIFRAALAIFGFLEPRLHYPDKEEIESVLEGRNRATQAITERERERARLRGETIDDTVDGTLSVFGLNEDALFDWLESDEWRESRFERLVTREMPD